MFILNLNNYTHLKSSIKPISLHYLYIYLFRFKIVLQLDKNLYRSVSISSSNILRILSITSMKMKKMNVYKLHIL